MTTRNRKNYVIDLAQLIAWAGLMLAPSLVDLTITRDWMGRPSGFSFPTLCF